MEGCIGCLGLIILGIIILAIQNWAITLSIIFVIGLIYSITNFINEKQKKIEELHKEFKVVFPTVSNRYSSVIEILNNNINSGKYYKKYIDKIQSNNIELYKKLREIKKELDKYETLKINLKETISASNNNEKNSISRDKLNKIVERHEIYNNYYQEAKRTINSTAQDYINVESELVLNNTNIDINTMEPLLASLEEKSKTLTYIQSNMPNFD